MKKKVVILLQFTRKFFFHGPNSSKSAKNFFVMGWGGGVVCRYLTSASYHFIF